MSGKLGRAKDVITGHYFSYKTFLVVLIILGGSLYITWAIARDRIMELWLLPAYDTVQTIPLLGPFIQWLATYTASWRWDQIILSTMMLGLGAFIGWFYGKPRTEKVEINSPTPEPSPEPETPVKTPSDFDYETAYKKLQADVEAMKKEKAEA